MAAPELVSSMLQAAGGEGADMVHATLGGGRRCHDMRVGCRATAGLGLVVMVALRGGLQVSSWWRRGLNPRRARVRCSDVSAPSGDANRPLRWCGAG